MMPMLSVSGRSCYQGPDHALGQHHSTLWSGGVGCHAVNSFEVISDGVLFPKMEK